MKQHTWTQPYTVSTFLVNPQKQLGLYGLLNLIQDTAWIHATHLGHGYEKMLKEKTAWVLTRQKLSMKSWPHWGDQIELVPWIRPVQGLLAIRDFEIRTNGEKIGDCTTQWLILNLETRKPAEKSLMLDDNEFRSDPPATIDASKIILEKNLTPFAEFHVRNSDLDLNGHVNNTRYAQWILDSVSLKKHLEYQIADYEVNFLAETKSGDVITIMGGELKEGEIQFQGVRKTDQKVMFAADLKVHARQIPLSSNLF